MTSGTVRRTRVNAVSVWFTTRRANRSHAAGLTVVGSMSTCASNRPSDVTVNATASNNVVVSRDMDSPGWWVVSGEW